MSLWFGPEGELFDNLDTRCVAAKDIACNSEPTARRRQGTKNRLPRLHFNDILLHDTQNVYDKDDIKEAAWSEIASVLDTCTWVILGTSQY